MRKILFAGVYPIWSFHFETELELIFQHLKKGDKIYYLSCNGENGGCPANSYGINKETCSRCISKRENGFKLTGLDNQVNKVNYKANEKTIIYPGFTSLEELKLHAIDNIDLGLGVTSSLISNTREPYPDLEKNQNLIESIYSVSQKVKLDFEDILEEVNPDVCYLFNGRFSELRVMLRTLQNRGIKTYVHERGSVLGKYRLTEDTYPHDLEVLKNTIQDFWSHVKDVQSAEEKAKKWYLDRREGKDQGWRSFTKNQKSGILDEFLTNKKKKVSIFISSEDEFEAIDSWRNPIYKNQNDALEKLVFDKELNKDVHFFLRIHPNLIGVENSQTKFLNNLQADNLTVFRAEFEISTYELIDNSDIVLSFGSTVGIEACYYQKTSVLAGRAAYEDLGGNIIPNSHDELIRILNNSSLYEIDKEKSYAAAIKYGYFVSEFGYNFENFNQVGVSEIYYNNSRITP